MPTTDGGTAQPRPARLQWYVRRLRAMSAREAAWRGRRTVETLVEDRLWRTVPAAWSRSWEPGLERILRDAPRAVPTGALLATDRLRAAASGSSQEEVGRMLESARLVRGGRLRLFGYPEAEVRPGVESRDPFTGGVWPLEHAKRLDYRRATAGDPKWVWEVNRLQHLPLLCLAAAASGEETFADEAATRALAWADASRPPYGIAWSNGFEAALRGISLALTLDALRGAAVLDADRRDSLLRSLWQHARWIERDPSVGSSANNHLLGEAVGLVSIGLLAPELRDAERWVADGLEVVGREVAAQILPDGSDAEQAFAYHLFVCDLVLLVVALLEARGAGTPPSALSAALHRAGDAIAAQVAPGEPDPAYGDSDDGRAFLFDGDDVRTARSVAASIACAVGHRACADLAGAPDLPSLVLFGDAGRARFEAAEGPPAPGSAVLPDSGLVVLRRAGSRAIFDAGGIGYLQIAAHGHADGLSVVLSDVSEELITDPGTGTYFGDPARRRTFRGTRAHGTVAVGDADQAEYGGPFLWLRHPSTRLLHVDLERGVAVGELTIHTGAARARHRRALVVLPGGEILVYDRIDGDARPPDTLTWPLHPALRVSRCAAGVVQAESDGRTRLLLAVAAARLDGPADLELTVDEGEWSRRLERVERAPVVRALVAGASDRAVVTLAVPVRGREPGDPRLSLEREEGAAVASFELGSPRRVRFTIDRDPVEVTVLAG